MDRIFKISLAAATAIGIIGGASVSGHAADLGPAPGPIEPYVQTDNYVSGWYVRADAGYSWLDMNSLDDGGSAIIGGGVGYQFNQRFRSDIRADHSFDADGGLYDVSGTTVTANGYVDFPIGFALTPYIGAGVGYGWVNNSGGGPADDSGFAWAATGGVAYNLSQNIALDVGYRYREIDVTGPNFADHSVMGGIRWNF